MSNTFLLYLGRSSGIVATVLAVFAMAWGLFFSARETGNRLRPAWWLDLHNWLGGLTLAFTILHVLAIFADSDFGIGLAQVFVPNTYRALPGAMTWGVVSMYIFAIVTLTSWARVKRRIPRRTWHLIHLTSIFAVVAAGIHGFQIGRDSRTLAFKTGLVLLGGAIVYPSVLRLFSVAAKRQEKQARVKSAR